MLWLTSRATVNVSCGEMMTTISFSFACSSMSSGICASPHTTMQLTFRSTASCCASTRSPKITRSSCSMNSDINGRLEATMATLPLSRYPCSFPTITWPSIVVAMLRYCVRALDKMSLSYTSM